MGCGREKNCRVSPPQDTPQRPFAEKTIWMSAVLWESKSYAHIAERKKIKRENTVLFNPTHKIDEGRAGKKKTQKLLPCLAASISNQESINLHSLLRSSV